MTDEYIRAAETLIGAQNLIDFLGTSIVHITAAQWEILLPAWEHLATHHRSKEEWIIITDKLLAGEQLSDEERYWTENVMFEPEYNTALVPTTPTANAMIQEKLAIRRAYYEAQQAQEEKSPLGEEESLSDDEIESLFFIPFENILSALVDRDVSILSADFLTHMQLFANEMNNLFARFPKYARKMLTIGTDENTTFSALFNNMGVKLNQQIFKSIAPTMVKYMTHLLFDGDNDPDRVAQWVALLNEIPTLELIQGSGMTLTKAPTLVSRFGQFIKISGFTPKPRDFNRLKGNLRQFDPSYLVILLKFDKPFSGETAAEYCERIVGKLKGRVTPEEEAGLRDAAYHRQQAREEGQRRAQEERQRKFETYRESRRQQRASEREQQRQQEFEKRRQRYRREQNIPTPPPQTPPGTPPQQQPSTPPGTPPQPATTPAGTPPPSPESKMEDDFKAIENSLVAYEEHVNSLPEQPNMQQIVAYGSQLEQDLETSQQTIILINEELHNVKTAFAQALEELKYARLMFTEVEGKRQSEEQHLAVLRDENKTVRNDLELALVKVTEYQQREQQLQSLIEDLKRDHEQAIIKLTKGYRQAMTVYEVTQTDQSRIIKELADQIRQLQAELEECRRLNTQAEALKQDLLDYIAFTEERLKKWEAWYQRYKQAMKHLVEMHEARVEEYQQLETRSDEERQQLLAEIQRLRERIRMGESSLRSVTEEKQALEELLAFARTHQRVPMSDEEMEEEAKGSPMSISPEVEAKGSPMATSPEVEERGLTRAQRFEYARGHLALQTTIDPVTLEQLMVLLHGMEAYPNALDPGEEDYFLRLMVKQPPPDYSSTAKGYIEFIVGRNPEKFFTQLWLFAKMLERRASDKPAFHVYLLLNVLKQPNIAPLFYTQLATYAGLQLSDIRELSISELIAGLKSMEQHFHRVLPDFNLRTTTPWVNELEVHLRINLLTLFTNVGFLPIPQVQTPPMRSEQMEDPVTPLVPPEVVQQVIQQEIIREYRPTLTVPSNNVLTPPPITIRMQLPWGPTLPAKRKLNEVSLKPAPVLQPKHRKVRKPREMHSPFANLGKGFHF